MIKFITLLFIFIFGSSCSNTSTKSERLDPDIVKYPDPRQRAYRKKISQDKTLFSDLFNRKEKSGNNTQNLNINVNPFMWKASIEVLSKTIPLASVDSNSGIIISDWYTLKNKVNERIKISVSVSTMELRADGLNVSLFRQINKGSAWVNVDADPKIITKIERKIMSKAGQLSSEID